MNHGDCFKLRLSEHWDFTLKFQDPRPFVESEGLLPLPGAGNPQDCSARENSGDEPDAKRMKLDVPVSVGNSGVDKPIRHLDLILANRENLKPYGWVVDDTVENPGLGIPFYKTVIEGANYHGATWKDQACVRTAQIHWRDDHSVTWLERHMEMTQGFIIMGKNPGLFVFGEPTHDREDLDEKQRSLPDPSNIKAFIIPAGMGIIIKKGTWHDFPVSCGPPVTSFVINTEEVVAALASMKSPAPMNHGDCFKLRLSEHWDFTLKFQDPRPFVQDKGLLQIPSN
jgi:ureidoglycolate lyase